MLASIEFDENERATLICALLSYAGVMAQPEVCVSLLDRVSPNPRRPWAEIVDEFRISIREAARAALSSEEGGG